jgi:hypothetical protein
VKRISGAKKRSTRGFSGLLLMPSYLLKDLWDAGFLPGNPACPLLSRKGACFIPFLCRFFFYEKENRKKIRRTMHIA